MTGTDGNGFWVTNHLANPVLRTLLRGPFGRRFGRRLAVLRYHGWHTGEVHELVVQYARDGDSVWIMAGQAERKRWWRNMTTPAAVELWLAGQHTTGTAVALVPGEHDPELQNALQTYRRVVPRAMSSSGSAVMVRVDLARSEDPTGMLDKRESESKQDCGIANATSHPASLPDASGGMLARSGSAETTAWTSSCRADYRSWCP